VTLQRANNSQSDPIYAALETVWRLKREYRPARHNGRESGEATKDFMTCPECGKDHFTDDGILKVIHGLERWKLVYDYTALILEMSASMHNDAADNRKGAFITRLRDCEECYFKGLWVGLMATAEEIVHDASGERPWVSLATLEKKVSKVVFDEDTLLSRNLGDPSMPEFKAMNILNTSTHLSALFLLHRSQLSIEQAKNMYERVLESVHAKAVHLKYVYEALQAGKDRNDIVQGIRSMRKAPP
jgi:hypothetical protein